MDETVQRSITLLRERGVPWEKIQVSHPDHTVEEIKNAYYAALQVQFDDRREDLIEQHLLNRVFHVADRAAQLTERSLQNGDTPGATGAMRTELSAIELAAKVARIHGQTSGQEEITLAKVERYAKDLERKAEQLAAEEGVTLPELLARYELAPIDGDIIEDAEVVE